MNLEVQADSGEARTGTTVRKLDILIQKIVTEIFFHIVEKIDIQVPADSCRRVARNIY